MPGSRPHFEVAVAHQRFAALKRQARSHPQRKTLFWGADPRLAVVVLLGLARDCSLRLRLGVVLLAGLLRRRPCPCLPMGPRHFACPPATHSTPSRVKNFFRLLRVLWTLRVCCWALRVFSSLTAPAWPAPGKVSTAKASSHGRSPSSRLAHSSTQQMTRKSSEWCALSCDRALSNTERVHSSLLLQNLQILKEKRNTMRGAQKPPGHVPDLARMSISPSSSEMATTARGMR